MRFLKDADVLAVASKQVGQIDWRPFNSAGNNIGDILIRVLNFFKKDAKDLSADLGHANKSSNADGHEPVVELMPKAGEKTVAQIQPNVPTEAARKENIKVISVDGMHVGNVERVFSDSTFDRITHLLISREIPARERKLIPVKWVQAMGAEAVHLHVTKDLVEELADASIIW